MTRNLTLQQISLIGQKLCLIFGVISSGSTNSAAHRLITPVEDKFTVVTTGHQSVIWRTLVEIQEFVNSI